MTCPPNWIRLNVGGKIFQTSKQTLSRDPGSFLAHLASEKIPSQKDQSGAILVDRDPEYFQVIVNYLRSGRLALPANIIVDQLMEEADFYGIQALYAAVEDVRKQQRQGAETIIVKSAVLRRIQKERSNEERFSVNWTTVNEALLDELKSPRRGLKVEEVAGGCIIVGPNIQYFGVGYGLDAGRLSATASSPAASSS